MSNNFPRALHGKAVEILTIATEVFLEKGYAGASINEVARRSGISKETVYRYFDNKEQLFAAVVDRELEGFWEALDPLNFEHATLDMREVLIRAGTNMIAHLSFPKTLAFRRIVFHESASKPEIGHIYYQSGPEATYRQLTQYFDAQKVKGFVSHVDSRTLSEYLTAMLLHKLTLIQLCSFEKNSSAEKIKLLVKKVIDDFMVAFFPSAEK